MKRGTIREIEFAQKILSRIEFTAQNSHLQIYLDVALRQIKRVLAADLTDGDRAVSPTEILVFCQHTGTVVDLELPEPNLLIQRREYVRPDTEDPDALLVIDTTDPSLEPKPL